MVIGTGFLISLYLKAVDTITLLMISVVNALMVLPPILRSIAPVLKMIPVSSIRNCAATGLKRLATLLPGGLAHDPKACCILSYSGGSALFWRHGGRRPVLDTTGHITLPVMLYQRMSAYRLTRQRLPPWRLW